jgi:hypothetical protein
VTKREGRERYDRLDMPVSYSTIRKEDDFKRKKRPTRKDGERNIYIRRKNARVQKEKQQ